VAAQFNRQVQGSDDLHTSALGEAGDIERISNTVLAMWNLEKDNKIGESGTKWMEERNIPIQKDNSIYIRVLKNRGGKDGQVDVLQFNGNQQVIKNK